MFVSPLLKDHIAFNSSSDPYICVTNLGHLWLDNGLSPGRCQAIFWTNTGILSIGLLGTNSSAIFIEIYMFSFIKIIFENVVRKLGAIFPGLNVLKPLWGVVFLGRSHFITQWGKNITSLWMWPNRHQKYKWGWINLTLPGCCGFFVLFTNKAIF